ncbi:MAG TPA: NAD(P)H-dependent oxidoreductase [Leptolyngbyaceae cyanobacterium M33_DOE_097]|uniref:C2H2-type domain-containing protein n=1 Tax=Oscillatoriales cyanobacterium SpSt-418 TaxID=2282169 RepID=A0A7C3KJV7_9CYAN|nr:NAD(P)H-dependent oxidoreductase [Leptolyngbyaceae cyanobacterium M33_DOE_097]
MTHILHLDASSRGDHSISRTLSKEFINQWKTAHPDDTVTYRDIGHHPVPFVSEDWIAAAYEECLRVGDSRTERLRQRWIHLRICQTCGKMLCCDSSKNQHARRHYEEIGHAVISSVELGEE